MNEFHVALSNFALLIKDSRLAEWVQLLMLIRRCTQ